MNPFSYLLTPNAQWHRLADQPLSYFPARCLYFLVLAALPAVAWYWGVTQIGWQVADGDAVKLTSQSALPIVVLFYFAMITSVAVIGFLTHWMSQTYGAETSLAKGMSLVGFFCTPLFVFGAVGFYPLLWVDLLVGVIALSWSVYLLYTGIPIVMKMPAERGFLYASAVVGVALVIFICILVASVLLWEFGWAPEFTD